MKLNKLFLGLVLGAMLLAFSFPAEAQQAKKIPRVGFLLAGGAPSPAPARPTNPTVESFRQGLRELGYVEGKNIIVEYRAAGGKFERLPDLAAELVRLKVDVIVTAGTPSIRAAQDATNTIPIVMANVGDPIAQGFVASLARPGGNITGFTNLSPDISTKRLELLKEVSPKIRRVAVFQNAAQHGPAMKEVEKAAKLLRVQLQVLEVRGRNDLDMAFEAVTRERADALITLANTSLRMNARTRIPIVEFTLKHRLPSMYEGSEYVETGGLMSYGPDEMANVRRAAVYVDKILKGTKPGDLPVEQPTKFDLVINLKTAKQLDLTIAPEILMRADKVIK
ncbi:MAG: ABC transporter substrate-binding protein [Deltaproteobacteria bacterium]|nr:ABC transporter substrate-binding protein [Deltaproteobacteria bacterium]